MSEDSQNQSEQQSDNQGQGQNLSQIIDYELDNFKNLKYLKENLYPTLNQAIEIVILNLLIS